MLSHPILALLRLVESPVVWLVPLGEGKHACVNAAVAGERDDRRCHVHLVCGTLCDEITSLMGLRLRHADLRGLGGKSARLCLCLLGNGKHACVNVACRW